MSGARRDGTGGGGRTPGARVGVVDGGVDVAEVDLAHEAVDLGGISVRGDGDGSGDAR